MLRSVRGGSSSFGGLTFATRGGYPCIPCSHESAEVCRCITHGLLGMYPREHEVSQSSDAVLLCRFLVLCKVTSYITVYWIEKLSVVIS